MYPIKVFLISPIDLYLPSLRRYSANGSSSRCVDGNYHDAQLECPELQCTLYQLPDSDDSYGDVFSHSYPSWPTRCAKCDYVFEDGDEWQFRPDRVHLTVGSAINYTLPKAPPGAMYYATWYEDRNLPDHTWVSPHDKRALMVVLPGVHHWHVDGTSNNCTLPGDPVHKCWVRSGSVDQATVHVDKNGNTCSAGAGSIVVPGWHGFLHNGYLTEC